MNLPKKKFAGLITTHKIAETPLVVLDSEGMKQLADELDNIGVNVIIQKDVTTMKYAKRYRKLIKFLRGE